MYHYKSTQEHTTMMNGKERTKRTSVEIHGTKGTKEVEIIETGRAPQKKTMRLKKNEISCIRRCKFIPGLFNDCTPTCISGDRDLMRQGLKSRDLMRQGLKSRDLMRPQMTRKKRRTI
jgi:hypothetical protein